MTVHLHDPQLVDTRTSGDADPLWQSAEGLRLMIESVRDYAIFRLDPAGYVTSWNIGAERINGYQADEIVSRHFSIFFTEEDRARGHPDEELARAREAGRYEEEGWRVRKDGTRFWANVVLSAVRDDHQRLIGFVKITRDFTESKRLREAQLAIQIRDDFLTTVGHELRTPLSALLLQVKGLVRTLPKDDRMRARLERAAAAGVRLEKLVEQMLDVARITSGRLSLEPEMVRLDALVREAADRLSDLSASSHSRVHFRLSPVTGQWDRFRLEQVVTNLLTNAFKYGNGRPIEIETGIEDGEAVFRLIDHGIGIAPEDQARIFERFERAAGTIDYNGFGLGLWVCRQIVRASGGKIEVHSAVGEGSTFTVRLPLHRRRESDGSGA